MAATYFILAKFQPIIFVSRQLRPTVILNEMKFVIQADITTLLKLDFVDVVGPLKDLKMTVVLNQDY